MRFSSSASWDQDQDFVHVKITVPAQASIGNLDVETTDAYIKVNCPPFLEIIDLYADVDEVASTGTVEGRVVTFKLAKRTRGEEWKQLQAEGSKEQLNARRQAAAEQRRQREAERSERKKAAKAAADDLVFHKQWDLDKEHRREIEDRKLAEKQAAEQDLYAWADKTEQHGGGGDDVEEEEEEDEEQPSNTATTSGSNGQQAPKLSRAEEEARARYRQLRQDPHAASTTKATTKPSTTSNNSSIPPPRQTSRVELTFTPKPTSLPARERIEEDDETLVGAGAPAHATAKPSEQSAAWLKERGDGFVRKGSYAAAVNAYTSALELDPTLASALSNRSACYLQLKKLPLAIADATSAIDRIVSKRRKDNVDVSTDIVTQVALARAHAHRSVAHVRLGMFKEGVRDMEAASKYMPTDSGLAADLATLVQSVAQSEYVASKTKGDEQFALGDYTSALAHYGRAIELDKGCWQAWSNRATCHLAMGHHAECVADADCALQLLDDKNDGGATPLALRVLVRRGVAHCGVGNFEMGRSDLERALKLDPHNQQLRHDLSLLKGSGDDSAQLNQMKQMLGLGGV